MPAEKDAAKRRRQARNRQERLNRQNRVEGAKKSPARPARTTTGRAEAKPDPSAAGKAAKPDDTARPAASGGFLDKLFPPRSDADGKTGRSDRPPPLTRTPSVVVEMEGTGAAAQIRHRLAQPGGMPVVLAFIAALASAVALIALPIVPRPVQEVPARMAVAASTSDKADRDARLETFDDAEPVTESARITDVVSPALAAGYALFPLLLTGMALISLTKVSRGRTLFFSAMLGALYVFMTGVFSFFLIGAALLGYAAYKTRKADVAALA